MAGPGKPVALVTVFSAGVLQRILNEIAAGSKPPSADWLVGTFGVNKAVATAVTGTPGCRYAPVFCIQPRTGMQARLRRQLLKEDAARVGDAAHAGEIPGSSEENVIPPGDRRAWGIELGRRFRDQIRAARSKGIAIEAWQFDEILGECGRSRSHREFVGGVLRGLAEGRPKLGDKPEQGFVWAATTAIRDLPQLPIAGDVQGFWEDLDAATLFLVGEEYPPFRGDPAVAARQFADRHKALGRTGKIRRSLANRYVVGMTPGWRPAATGLGGNVDGKPAAEVTKWRNGFIDARIAGRRPGGFAQFNVVKENTRQSRLEDAVRSLHHASKQVGL